MGMKNRSIENLYIGNHSLEKRSLENRSIENRSIENCSVENRFIDPINSIVPSVISPRGEQSSLDNDLSWTSQKWGEYAHTCKGHH
jgi:hypothetical protein